MRTRRGIRGGDSCRDGRQRRTRQKHERGRDDKGYDKKSFHACPSLL